MNQEGGGDNLDYPLLKSWAPAREKNCGGRVPSFQKGSGKKRKNFLEGTERRGLRNNCSALGEE